VRKGKNSYFSTEKLTFGSTNFLRWSDFVFRRWLSVSWQRKSSQFIETRNLLQRLQQSATCPFPGPRLIHSTPHILPDFFQIDFLYNLIHGLLTWNGLFSLLCIQCSVLFCDILLLCGTVFLLCIVLFIVLVLYCVCLWCMCCYPNGGFSVLFFSCKANARVQFAKTGHGPHFPI
jgi:hypothetical protein